jgi:hypothetical protein
MNYLLFVDDKIAGAHKLLHMFKGHQQATSSSSSIGGDTYGQPPQECMFLFCNRLYLFHFLQFLVEAIGGQMMYMMLVVVIINIINNIMADEMIRSVHVIIEYPSFFVSTIVFFSCTYLFCIM